MVWCFFLFSSVLRVRFLVFLAPFPEEEISDHIAHGPIIRLLTVDLGFGFVSHVPRVIIGDRKERTRGGKKEKGAWNRGS